MSLAEILRSPQHKNKRFSLSSFDLEHKQKIGYSEWDLVVYQAHTKSDPEVFLFGLFEKDILLTAVIGKFFMLDGAKTFTIKDVFTPTGYRMKGYVTALYSFLIKDMKLRLLSDVEQTPSGEKLWKSIRKIFPVKIYDKATRKVLEPTDVSDDEIYTYDESKNRYLFIVESWLTEGMLEIPTVSGDILKKYQFYTHPSKYGAYA